MNETCTDNRFEVIAAYKKKLKERTNIETSPDEMAVIDHMLFRFWQMGWLPPVPHGRLGDLDALITTFCEWGTSLERKGTLIITMAEAKQTIVDIIEKATTIIPAEPPKEEA